MNRYQKREVFLTKRLISAVRKDSFLHDFRIARFHVRCCLYNRHQEFLDWVLKAKIRN